MAPRIEPQELQLALGGDHPTAPPPAVAAVPRAAVAAVPRAAVAAVPRAAVAAIFAPGGRDTELLFIQRAIRAGDPWSGHMAFPGGRAEPGDVDTLHTAERETQEEIGLDLSPTAQRLGSLADIDGGTASNRPIVVSGHCYWLGGERPALTPNHEVNDVVWIALADLLDQNRYIEYRYRSSGLSFPGIQLDRADQVIWGLTLRMLGDLFARLGRAFII